LKSKKELFIVTHLIQKYYMNYSKVNRTVVIIDAQQASAAAGTLKRAAERRR
jgi:hypothetical protein